MDPMEIIDTRKSQVSGAGIGCDTRKSQVSGAGIGCYTRKSQVSGMGVGYSPDTRHPYPRHPTSPGIHPNLFFRYCSFCKLSQINLLLAVI